MFDELLKLFTEVQTNLPAIEATAQEGIDLIESALNLFAPDAAGPFIDKLNAIKAGILGASCSPSKGE